MATETINNYLQGIVIPRRIVSVVPSQTELLYDLGLDEEVVGITKFCIHPEKWFRTKQRIGGTKNLNLELIESLHPDLIIANKEENTKEQIEALSKKFPVWWSDIETFSEAIAMINSIGKMTGKADMAKHIVDEILAKKTRLIIKSNNKKVLYLIWKSPYMVAGKDTFIYEMLSIAGYENVIIDNRYPIVTENDILNLNPDIVFLSSEPYPFKEKHILELQQLLPAATIKLVDGELFSWYGSRMLKSFDYFRALHEELV